MKASHLTRLPPQLLLILVSQLRLASAVTLQDLGFPAPILAPTGCNAVFSSNIPNCQPNDFTDGCSTACVSGISQIFASLTNQCGGSLVGSLLNSIASTTGVAALCRGGINSSTPSSSPAPSSSPTKSASQVPPAATAASPQPAATPSSTSLSTPSTTITTSSNLAQSTSIQSSTSAITFPTLLTPLPASTLPETPYIVQSPSRSTLVTSTSTSSLETSKSTLVQGAATASPKPDQMIGQQNSRLPTIVAAVIGTLVGVIVILIIIIFLLIWWRRRRCSRNSRHPYVEKQPSAAPSLVSFEETFNRRVDLSIQEYPPSSGRFDNAETYAPTAPLARNASTISRDDPQYETVTVGLQRSNTNMSTTTYEVSPISRDEPMDWGTWISTRGIDRQEPEPPRQPSNAARRNGPFIMRVSTINETRELDGVDTIIHELPGDSRYNRRSQWTRSGDSIAKI